MAVMNASHIAILGRQPELGLVELESVLGSDHLEPFGRGAALLDQTMAIDLLGGTVKLGRIIYNGPAAQIHPLPIAMDALPVSEGKTTFAISAYGLGASSRLVIAAGLELKKQLRAHGSVRFVAPTKGSEVTAAQLKFNHVLSDGFELVVVVHKQRMVIALTEGVQDIDWYSKRDYDRPARSAKVGMLPPKLAQIMVNTTHAGVVVDPFCGTGVVLQEALLLGRDVTGSDMAPEMVAASRENLQWLGGVAPSPLGSWTVQEPADARTVHLPDLDCAVVSEGYLGPNLTMSPGLERLNEIRPELGKLYRDTLKNWAGQLESGAELALCVPAWRVNNAWHYLGLVDDLGRLGYTVKVFKHVHGPLLYSRSDQTVGRQLLLLTRS